MFGQFKLIKNKFEWSMDCYFIKYERFKMKVPILTNNVWDSRRHSPRIAKVITVEARIPQSRATDFWISFHWTGGYILETQSYTRFRSGTIRALDI